ncbi:protein CHLOROPLAST VESICULATION [Henckelia pumila]|uniref:protein CHLOROPLAST VESICULATION n=1 Tax=Henckelia pumila TaxID=405737 RepID=UPI003C6E48B4
MGLLTNCCLNFSPPPLGTSISPPPPNSRTSQVVCSPPKERSWKTQSVIVLTCAIIGLDLRSLVFVNNNRQDWVLAGEMEMESTSNTVREQRWSDRRACQPWRINSLETIVPENLPRPSAQRSWEAAAFPPEGAPPIFVLPKFGTKSCYIL